MADMIDAVHRMPPAQRSQYVRLVCARTLSGCTKSIVELVSAELFLQLNGMDYARTARVVAVLSTANTCSDFLFGPLMGALIDAYGRRRSLLAAQLVETLTALLVGLRPSIPSFVLWQLLREFSRRANKPARLAMMGDFVGRASADFVHLHNASEMVSEAARLVAMQVVARVVASDTHRGFLYGAGCSAAAFLVTLLSLHESLPVAKVKKIRSLRTAINPLSFVRFFRQSKGLSGMGALLTCWQVSSQSLQRIRAGCPTYA